MSGQPGPMGPQQPGPGGPQQPGPMGPPPSAVDGVPPPPAKKRRGPLLGLLLGGVALVVVVALVVGFLVLRTDGRTKAVEEFFAALGSADAAAAISHLATPPADQSLMTDEVLRASVDLGGVSLVEVTDSGADSGDAGWVTAKVRANGEDKTIDYQLVKQDGQWKLADAIAEVKVTKTSTDGLKPVFNGATPDDETTFHLFPAMYEVTTGSELVTWDEENVAFFGGSGASDTLNVTPKLTEQGDEAVQKGLEEMYKRCLASTELEPENCPFHALDPRFKEGTARWQEVQPPTWGASLFGLVVSGQYEGVVKVDYTYVDSGGASHQKSVTIPYKPVINFDLSKDPPELIFPR